MLVAAKYYCPNIGIIDFKMKRIFILPIFSALIFGSITTYAQNNQAIALSGDARNSAIQMANNSINSLDKIEGRFVQYNANNTSITGSFWLDRPGKMRFEYDAPSPVLLTSDGSGIAILDKKLNTVERYPLRSNPLYFLLKSNLNIAQELKITNVIKAQNQTLISLRDKKNEAQGELTLTFDASNHLSQWQIVDNRKRTTIVKLINIKPSPQKEASFFVIKTPKGPGSIGKH